MKTSSRRRPAERSGSPVGSCAVMAAIWVVCGCNASPRPAARLDKVPEAVGSSGVSSSEEEGVIANVPFVEIETGRDRHSPDLPMIVAIHGRGGSPEQWVSMWRAFQEPARIILPRGSLAYEGGFQWFESPASYATMTDADASRLAENVSRRADGLATFIGDLSRRYPVRGKPLVMGFSQGALVSFAIAVRHGTEIGGAFPVSGFLPGPMRSSAPLSAPTATVVAFHGVDDARVPIALAQASTDYLRSQGVSAELRTYAGTSHEVSPQIWDDLRSLLEERCKHL